MKQEGEDKNDFIHGNALFNSLHYTFLLLIFTQKLLHFSSIIQAKPWFHQYTFVDN